MSIRVEPAVVWEHIDTYGDQAYLVTVTDDSTPHVVSVVVRRDGDLIVVGAGRRTRANLEGRPAATLLWPPADDPAYSLLVDASMVADRPDDDAVAFEATSAVLHRVSGAPGDGPNCVNLE